MGEKLVENELEDVSKLISRTLIPELVKIADKYNYERDSLIEYVAAMFWTIAKTSSFKNWRTEKEG